MKDNLNRIKEFGPASWAIDNKISIFVMTIIITLWGLMSYNNLPKESFPEIIIPKIFVTTVYPGTSPTNMENLVTKPLEKRMKSIAGVKKITSNSYQDYSVITVEFNTNVQIPVAKSKVKEEIDRAARDLPQDLPQEPQAMDVNLSELPIMYVNISGNFDLNKLKQYAESMQDRIESLKEITKVDITGALDREIQINVDMYRMQAAQLTLGDIERTIGFENLTMSGGNVPMEGMRRTINIKGEFKTVEELKKLIIKSPNGAPIYLRDIAEVKDSFREQESYARLDGKNVITLAVKKRAGENLIEASDKIQEIVKDMKKNDFPAGLDVVITGDQADQTRITLHDLINTIIIGFILVTIILMFFMGATNAFFVALSVPLSMALAFMVMPVFGLTMNMIVLFAFLLALGIVVDDAIVVIENTHRIFNNGKVPIVKAAKAAAGEVFLPVLSGTLTTLAPFIPLLFWDGVIGEFMQFLPKTLIITLLASLLVAYIINPVFAVATMKPHDDEYAGSKKITRGSKIFLMILIVMAVLSYLIAIGAAASGSDHHKAFGWGNFIVTLILLFALYKYAIKGAIKKFQTKTWPRIQDRYVSALKWSLQRPKTMLWGTVVLFFVSIIALIASGTNVVFFPQSDPNFVYVYISMPVGTDQAKTDSITQLVERKVYKVLDMGNGKKNPLVKSVIANVTQNVTDPQDEDQGVYPNKSKIAVSFVPYADRNGASTSEYLDKIRSAVQGMMPGVEITVNQEQAGPPVPKPISIEITGENLGLLVRTSDRVKKYLDSLKIAGVEELRSDFQDNKPEIVFDIDRERANREGIAIGQIAMEIRKAVFGLDNASKFRDENDEYPIQLRYAYDQRTNIEAIRNLKITYRDMAMGGMIRSVPLSAFVDIRYENSYGGIKRKDQKRIITLSSNVLGGYNPNEVVGNIQASLASFKSPENVQITMAGEQEEQKETGAFLGRALLISLGLIFVILVTQFNSFSKPIIILTEILFSIIGVLLGVVIFGMDMSVVMSGVGIVALAGIVVRNGILLVEFTDLMKKEGMSTYDAIVEAGRTRMTPVILTATATILGLVPLAVGFNIDFVKMFTHLSPHIYFGGDSVAFWGPLSWTMIFGLGFATFLTLVLVPVMYLLADKAKARNQRILKYLDLPAVLMYIPLVVPVCRIFVPARIVKGEVEEKIMHV